MSPANPIANWSDEERRLAEEILGRGAPAHVAMIMDGNGRWAKKRTWNRLKGHHAGRETVRMAIKTCRALGIGHLTLYTFSSENWKRPAYEVQGLMKLLKDSLLQERAELDAAGVRFRFLGDPDALPADVRAVVDESLEMLGGNEDLVMSLAINYGGRAEIVAAARRLAERVAAGELEAAAIDEEAFEASLWTAGLPDPDLLIRTGGDMRISNYLLWQMAYTEFFFTPTLWPEFERREFLEILASFGDRERRFGGVKP